MVIVLELDFVIFAGDWKEGGGLGLICIFPLGSFGHFAVALKCVAE